MARIRTIKPEFFTSEDIVQLSPHARLLYIACWCEADKEGRLQWKPLTLKIRYFPVDDVDIRALCEELIGAGLVVPYGDGLAYIPKFGAHQHINPRESASQLPAPAGDSRVPDVSLTRGEREGDAPAPVTDAQGGREGKGRERKEDASGRVGPRKRAPTKHPLPDGFGISDRVQAWAADKGHDRLDQHLESFRAKAQAKGYAYADWDAAFMEAIRENWAKLPAAGSAAPPDQRPGGGRREL
ncbi:hypothetical protein CSC62_05360 [Pseudoxanthomonas jiangsuensis]|uniref:hypothetical protein n=1 Tax=Pseudoxanthomonas jiangsuensis TaxID=619688 RepID=UPI00139126B7|nr:hypothetical protein [Pseudoxanthomonas jiangsuensis]KAF1698338.1 hypothetical protein CSC62_05360 [Pseudoxanthomonas jiangsuensis]